MTCLNTGTATRINPATGDGSTPDVTFVTGGLAGGATWQVDQSIGSDHLPITITITITTAPTRPKRRGRGRLAMKKAKWEEFRKEVDRHIAEWRSKPVPASVAERDKRFTTTLMSAAKRTIPFGNGGGRRSPFWNDSCEEAVRTREEALRRATAPGHTAEDVAEYQRVRAQADATIQQEKTDFLRGEIARMGPNADMWGLIRTLDGRKPTAKPAEPLNRPHLPGHPPPQRPAVTDREKADVLCQTYSAVSRIPKNKTSDRPIKLEARAAMRSCVCNGTKSGMCAPFTEAELAAALHKIQPRKSPGPDGIPNDLLIQLSPTAKRELLSLINSSWTQAVVPPAWRSAHIVAIPKKGKPPAETSSYRPISLLSTTSKLAERMVQARLQHFLESEGKINPHQAGFRRGHSTMDQLAGITQRIFDAFEQKRPHRAVLVLLDFARAYDRVWRAGLYAKMSRMGVPGCAVRWVKALLSDSKSQSPIGRRPIAQQNIPGEPAGGECPGPSVMAHLRE